MIQNKMEKNKISQAELSRRTGISVKNISDWKHKKTNPNAESLLPICDALDIELNLKEVFNSDVGQIQFKGLHTKRLCSQ